MAVDIVVLTSLSHVYIPGPVAIPCGRFLVGAPNIYIYILVMISFYLVLCADSDSVLHQFHFLLYNNQLTGVT